MYTVLCGTPNVVLLPNFRTMKRKLSMLLVLIGTAATAQVKNLPGKEFLVRKAVDAIKIDGQLTEASWQGAERGQNFWVSKPIDTVAAANATYFSITFDDDNLYVAFECIDDGGAPIVQSLRRDFEFTPNDNVGIYLNTYNDFTNGFFFNITPYGVQREGIEANAGTTSGDYSSFWDNKWYSAVERKADRWIAEIAIPFKSIRYNRDTWNFNVLRNDVERNQASSWIFTPVQYLPAAFQNSGKIVWQEPLPDPGTNISLIPYVTARATQNTGTDEPPVNVGLDAKFAITPSLNLDLTINPDFSNVEVDRQVINLTRFEVNFPERRQFFLENSDLFSTPGFVETRPFFSRRIGIESDSLGNLVRVPLLYGARVSGKLGKNWRVGVLNTQTKEDKALGLPEQNYSVAVVQRQVFERSNVDVVFINKESLGLKKYEVGRKYHHSLIRERYETNGDTTLVLNRYNRVLGADFNLLTANNKWNGDVYYFRSLDDFNKSDNYAFGAFLGYFSRNLNAYMGHENLGAGYNAEVGFLPQLARYPGYRNGFVRVENPIYPKKSTRVANLFPGYGAGFTMTPDGKITDKNIGVDFGINNYNTSGIGFSYSYTSVVLTDDFNPSKGKKVNTDKPDYLIGQEFSYHRVAAGFNSDARRLLNWEAGTSYGSFYAGTLLNLNASVRYRYQPFGSISIESDYNDIRLGQDYGNAVFFLLSPRLDFTFTDKLFLTTFVQYNSRADNVNLNARFQWRFKPASDFFVVYTENYLPENLSSKNRALVLKLTYWFNL